MNESIFDPRAVAPRDEAMLAACLNMSLRDLHDWLNQTAAREIDREKN